MSTIAYPSPRGDKLCLRQFTYCHSTQKFPSPRGDKLCQESALESLRRQLFPSPRGDKLCRVMIHSTGANNPVSVPSRG